jgi:hypothetical protein
MRRHFALAAAAAVVSLLAIQTPANAQTVGTAEGIRQGVTETSGIQKAVRVCRHNFKSSDRRCWTDRSRPPTVCHHIRSTSRRDCY